MNFKLVFILLLFCFNAFSQAQIDSIPAFATKSNLATYTIKKTAFSSNDFSEFAPVMFKDKLVFCTDRNTGVSNYSTSENQRFFDIYCIDTVDIKKGKKVKPFAKELNSKLNDGPVTFNSTGDTIYYSRNLIIDGNLDKLSSNLNKLGVFYAVNEEGQWKNISEFRFNNEWYHVTTPCLSPDGKRVYFASDRVDGLGGSDLWYSDWKDGFWDAPVNLGATINTSGNEAYPFMNKAGDLFFSSDGHPGLGGRDIFISHYSNNSWRQPVALDSPINSEYEDFGIVTNQLVDEGYFSSLRGKSLDIYYFKSNFPQIFFPTFQQENLFCFSFNDPGNIEIDSLDMAFRWTFGDGQTATGPKIEHCYPGQGTYKVSLDIVDKKSGKRFFTKLSYTLELRAIEQPFIFAPLTTMVGEETRFDGLYSHLPNFTILEFYWDFGDGTRSSGDIVNHTYANEGEYTVNLFLKLQNDSTLELDKRTIAKNIGVFKSTTERNNYLASQTAKQSEFPFVKNTANATIHDSYSAEANFHDGAVFTIELARSKRKLNLQSPNFRRLPKKYNLREWYEKEDSMYSYTVEQRLSLMQCYPAFDELVKTGFKDAIIKIHSIEDPAEKELLSFIKMYGSSADMYFDSYERLTSTGYIMLDQIARILSKYPKTRIEVGVHSDLSGTPAANLLQTQRRSETIVNYLINKGIDPKQLTNIGYGELKPISTSTKAKARIINKRIEFNILEF